MPKKYAMGGRAPCGAPRRRIAAPPQRQTFRERLGALRNLPPFLKLVWRTSPALTSSQAALRIVRALLPVVTLYVGKLIIDEVVLLAARANAHDTLRQWMASGELDRLGGLIALEFGLAVASDVLGRFVSLLDSLLSEQFSNETSLRLMEHAATLDLEDFEDSELQDRLERARRQAAGRTSLIGQLFSQAQDVVTIASFGAGLVDLRAVAHRAPRHRALAGVRRRGAFQRAELFAQLRAHARAARARLRAADGSERRDGEGSEDLRPEPLPDRALPDAGRELLRRQSPHRAAARRLGQPALGDRHGGLLRGLRLHRLAHAARRVHDRRPHVSRRLVPAPAQSARGPADGFLAGRGPGALSRRSLLVLRDPAGNRQPAESAAVSRRRYGKDSLSRTSASATRAPSAGPCAG